MNDKKDRWNAVSHLKNSLRGKETNNKANIYRTLNKNQVLFQGALYELN